MFEISVKTRFSAAHRLKGYKGSCATIHGHNWDVRVFLEGPRLDSAGLLLDFRQLKRHVTEAVSVLDHTDLNELPPFRERNPSSERIAELLAGELSAKLDSDRCWVSRVSVCETPDSQATFWTERALKPRGNYE